MLKIGKIEKVTANGKTRLSAKIEIEGSLYPLWYEVDAKYGDALCDSRSDAFVAGLFLYAINHRHDIEFETPITDELKTSIEENFLLAVCDHNKDVYCVKLTGPVAPVVRKDKVVRLSGISCGADSLYTVLRRFVHEDKNGAIDYLAIYNHHGTIGRSDSVQPAGERARRFADIVARAREFSTETGLPLIVGDTNYNSGEIPGLISEGYATFVNMFCAMCMQNLISHYLLASAGGVGEFGYYLRQGLYHTVHENYDLLTTAAFSTQGFRITIDGLVERDKKIKYLAEQPLAYKYLDVCLKHTSGIRGNGTNDCPKCMYTILELMALGEGVLDRFSAVFDVDYVRSHKYVYLADMIRGLLQKSLYAEQCWPRRHVMGFTMKDYLKAGIVVGRKIIKKIFRRGEISYEFSPEGK